MAREEMEFITRFPSELRHFIRSRYAGFQSYSPNEPSGGIHAPRSRIGINMEES
jgi:hypothetical protein